MSKQAMKRVRRALKMEVNRKPLDACAWPGGYPLFYLFTDGGCICPECANANIVEIDAAMRDARGNRPHSSGCGGWAIDAVEANWEDDSLTCDHCGERIESAYGCAPGITADEERAYGPSGAPASQKHEYR